MTHLSQMNLVNLSTAVHRIAKLASNDYKAQAEIRQHPAFEELLNTIVQVLSTMEASEAQPQSLSNVAWSLATLRLMNRPLIQVVSALAVTNISCFKPFELSTMLWAFAKLTTVDQYSWSLKPVFQAAAAHIMKNIAEFGFRCLATTAWAFATARQRHARLFRSIASQMVPVVHVANCQEMANTAWAFATADFHDDQLFTQLAEKALTRLDEFKSQELSNMLWGFATNGFFHEAFFAHASLVTQHMNLEAQHLANILWAFVRVRARHPVTHSTILSLLPTCTSKLETFKPQEVSSTALAVAKAFGLCDELERSPPPTYHALPHQVVDFLHRAMPWALSRLHEFSAQSLANTVSAFAMVRTAGDMALFSAIAQEVLGRYESLEPTALLHLLKGFSAAPQDVCGCVTKTLAAGVAHHIDSFRPQELQTLSRICISLLRLRRSQDLSTDELRSCCATIVAMEVIPSSVPHLDLHDEITRRHSLEDERTVPHSRLELRDSGYPRNGAVPETSLASLTLGKLLALEDSMLGIGDGCLPGMPPNALYESDFNCNGSPPAAGGRIMKPQVTYLPPQLRGRGRSPVQDLSDEVVINSHAEDLYMRDLSPQNHIGRAPPLVNPYFVSQSAAQTRRDTNTRNAIRNQKMPANLKGLVALDTRGLGTINESGLPIPGPMPPMEISIAHAPQLELDAIAQAVLPVMATQLSIEDDEVSDDDDEGGDDSKHWRFSVKNSFLHVDYGENGPEEREESLEDIASQHDGASQRSSSVPSRFEVDENYEEFSRHRGLGQERHWNKQHANLDNLEKHWHTTGNLDFDFGAASQRRLSPNAVAWAKARPSASTAWQSELEPTLVPPAPRLASIVEGIRVHRESC
jgi:hypothetical protein